MHKWVVCCVALIAASASAAIPPTERTALIDLYNATGGASWIDRTNWLGAAGTECTWFGVTCDDAQTTVVELDLTANDLDGAFPIAQLRALPSLRELWLEENFLTGPLTPAIGDLRTLEVLNLGFNPLGGVIPKEIAELPNLWGLGLFFAELEGTVPQELWRMTELEQLYLDGNSLTGSIPADVAQLINLQYLSLGSNDFSGPLPVELATLSNLVELWLESNSFSGPIPHQLGQLRDLTFLVLYDNDLDGSIPTTLVDLQKLEYLVLHQNDLTGSIPSELGSMTSLIGLYLGANELRGPLPATLSNLVNLQEFHVSGNSHSGTIPDWIGTLKELRYLSLDDSGFSGPIPPSIWELTNLTSLGLGSNRVTGSLPAAIGNLTQLETLSIHFTSMSGPMPPQIGNLQNLEYLFASQAGLTGPIPREFGNLRNLLYAAFHDNHLDGTLPPEIGNLDRIESLDLSANRLTGPIPREIGNLSSVRYLYLDENALRGPIPVEITSLTSMEDLGLFIHGNALTITDPAVSAFIEQKALFGLDGVQTVTPLNVRVVSTTDRSATVAWDEIDHYGPGGYQIVARPAGGGPAVSIFTTRYIFDEEGVIRNLSPETTYSITVSTITYPSYTQKNLLVSDPSPAVTATTTTRVLAPAEIQVTERTRGLVQIDGVPQNEDQFTLTNVGDVATNVTLDIETDFATFEPSQFQLGAGASQTVIVRSLPQPQGYYYGYVWAMGEETLELVTVSLFSAPKPQGFVLAEAVDSRVDVAGEPGSDSVGQVRFHNVGTAMLAGVLISDQPWIVPDDSQVFIFPDSVGSVTFQVLRSRRPPGAEGALVANLTLVYVGIETNNARALGTGSGATVNVTKVTIVDVSRPATSSATIPPGLGDVAFFVPGISSFLRGQTSFVSDVSLLNNSSGSPATDVRLYFTPSGTQQTTVATLAPIPATNSVTLTNILDTVYQTPSGLGSLQIRSSQAQNIVVQAQLLGLSESGSVAGEVPVFRSDRSVAAGERTYLTGVKQGSTLYIQETQGLTTSVTIDYIDAEGRAVGARGTASVAPWSVLELPAAVPAGAVTAILTNDGSGGISAYARVFDDATGDHWSVVDWSRVHAYKLGEVLRLPFAGVASAPPPTGGGRRRAVSHGASASSSSNLSLFNPAAAEIAATIEVLDANGSVRERQEVVIGPSQTRSVEISGVHAVVTPLERAELVVTARGSRTGIPVIPAATGLGLGRSQIFSNLEDSTEATVNAATPGTYRTTLGLVETAGAAAVVRARIYLDEGRGLASSIIYRDFTVNPKQQLVIDNLVRAIVGPSRETRLGELHGLQLRLEVISGSGAVVPFIITTDNGTNDSLLRLE